MPPLGFVDWLRVELTQAGIRYALTSGRACVCFGLQQTTKDSDWIIDLQDLDQFRELLAHWDSGEAWRVQHLEFEADTAGLAARHVVAQMKKTDREKDWPFVFGIGRQMLERGDWRGVLHLQDAESLMAQALADTAEIMAATPDELEKIAPPGEIVLP